MSSGGSDSIGESASPSDLEPLLGAEAGVPPSQKQQSLQRRISHQSQQKNATPGGGSSSPSLSSPPPPVQNQEWYGNDDNSPKSIPAPTPTPPATNFSPGVGRATHRAGNHHDHGDSCDESKTRKPRSFAVACAHAFADCSNAGAGGGAERSNANLGGLVHIIKLVSIACALAAVLHLAARPDGSASTRGGARSASAGAGFVPGLVAPDPATSERKEADKSLDQSNDGSTRLEDGEEGDMEEMEGETDLSDENGGNGDSDGDGDATTIGSGGSSMMMQQQHLPPPPPGMMYAPNTNALMMQQPQAIATNDGQLYLMPQLPQQQGGGGMYMMPNGQLLVMPAQAQQKQQQQKEEEEQQQQQQTYMMPNGHFVFPALQQQQQGVYMMQNGMLVPLMMQPPASPQETSDDGATAAAAATAADASPASFPTAESGEEKQEDASITAEDIISSAADASTVVGQQQPQEETVVPAALSDGQVPASNIAELAHLELKELSNFKDAWEPWEKSDVPVFFHIPKAGGSTVKDIIGTCHRFVMATEYGVTDGHADDEEVAIVYPVGGPAGQDRSAFVNVDTTTIAGIERAARMGFADAGLADAVVTPFIYEANHLFTPTAKGRLFTVFRHPIDRAISLFYYLQVADWEPTYAPEMKDWSIEQYAQSDKVENNWLVRQLTHKFEGDLEEYDLKLSMEVVRRKFLVGLMTEIESTMTRCERYFRWTYHVNPTNQEMCRARLLEGGSNKNVKKKKVEEGSEAWQLLAHQNNYDLQLYQYIEVLFVEQEQFVQGIPEDIRNVDATCCKCGPPTYPKEGFTCPLAILNEDESGKDVRIYSRFSSGDAIKTKDGLEVNSSDHSTEQGGQEVAPAEEDMKN